MKISRPEEEASIPEVIKVFRNTITGESMSNTGIEKISHSIFPQNQRVALLQAFSTDKDIFDEDFNRYIEAHLSNQLLLKLNNSVTDNRKYSFPFGPIIVKKKSII